MAGLMICVLLGMFLGLGGYTFIYARGYSYLSDDPAVCVNCHVMREQYDGWSKASHHAVATCNDCHASNTQAYRKLGIEEGAPGTLTDAFQSDTTQAQLMKGFDKLCSMKFANDLDKPDKLCGQPPIFRGGPHGWRQRERSS